MSDHPEEGVTVELSARRRRRTELPPDCCGHAAPRHRLNGYLDENITVSCSIAGCACAFDAEVEVQLVRVLR